jgi:hypothetical protein
MLIPVGEDVSVAVTVVLLGPSPEFREAELVRLDVETLRLRLLGDGGPAPAVGTRLIVNAAERTKLQGKVLAVDAGGIVVSRDRVSATDDRAAPRVLSHVELRWRGVDSEAASASWLAGGADPGPFVTFRGGADLSLSGVRIPTTSRPPPVGGRVWVELALGGERHRILGIVRRVEQNDRASELARVNEAGLAFGVEFVELPEPTFDALSDFTLRNL